MNGWIIFFIIVALIYIVYRIRYSMILTEYEINQLATGRRISKINQHYRFSKTECSVNKEFKKKMKADGRFYNLDEKLYYFPALAAGLLKYKKHEWIIIAFEKELKVKLIWVNKGFNKSCVGLKIDFNEVVNMACEEGFTTIMMFHNHPNNNPNRYDCTNPSEADLNSALKFWKICEAKKINYIEYICERGIAYRYFLEVIDEFYPFLDETESIKKVNGISANKNYSLHRERMRLANIKVLLY